MTQEPPRSLPRVHPERTATVAVAATAIAAARPVLAIVLGVCLYSGFSSQPIFIPWEFVGPLLAEAAIMIVVVIGLHQRSRIAYVAAVALHARQLLANASRIRAAHRRRRHHALLDADRRSSSRWRWHRRSSGRRTAAPCDLPGIQPGSVLHPDAGQLLLT